jgi:hypothetical protein
VRKEDKKRQMETGGEKRRQKEIKEEKWSKKETIGEKWRQKVITGEKKERNGERKKRSCSSRLVPSFNVSCLRCTRRCTSYR